MMRRNGGTLSKPLPFSRAKDWPDPPTEDFLPQPRRPDDLLAYWECWLYNKYRTAYCERADGISPGWNRQWMTRMRDFWDRLATCEELTSRCLAHPCRPLHDVIVLLFFFADLVKKDPPVRGIFGIERHGNMDKGLAQARREAKSDARALEDIKRLADGVSRLSIFDDERAMLNTIVHRAMHRAVSQVEPSTFTFDDIVLPEAQPETFDDIVLPEDRLDTIALVPQLNREPPSRRAKLFRHGADENLYLTLLVNFLKKCPRRGQLKTALAILDRFYPPQFGKDYTEDHLRLRLRDFRKRPGVQGHIDEMTKWFEEPTDIQKPTVTELCPCPNFLLPPTSSTVADKAR